MSDQQLANVPRKPPILAGARGLQLNTLDDMYRFAQYVANSGLAPKDFSTPEAVLVAVQRGLELGMSPMQSLESVAVINGRTCLWGDAPLALCMVHPDFEDIEEDIEAEGVTCTVKRRGRTPTRRTFTVTDAKRANLLNKAGPWTQYPARMLQLRARAFALRDSFPDALRGIGVAEEVRDTPEEQREPRQANAREIPKAILPEEPAQLEAPAAEMEPQELALEVDK